MSNGRSLSAGRSSSAGWSSSARPLLALVCLTGLLVLLPAQGARAVPAAQVQAVTRAQDWVQQTAAEFGLGERTGIDVTDVEGGELRLSPGAASGVYVSPAVSADFPFNAVAARWSADVPPGASVEVELRVLTGTSGGWSAWQPFVAVEWDALRGEFYPEAPLMFSDGRQFQYRLTIGLSALAPSGQAGGGRSPVIRRMTVTYVDTSVGPTTAQARVRMQAQDITAHGVVRPAIISRAGWGADESYRTWEPVIRPVFKMVVHHTVTPNDYAEDQSAAWVRAIYYYHAVTLDWGDVGYNYLVDSYGNIYEGRYGGPGVVGGHVYSYNYGSVGIALVGTHGNTGNSVAPSTAALGALRSLCVWEASRSYIYPLESAPFFGAETPNLGGHRDYPPQRTSCPGDLAYAALPALRQGVWQGLTAALPRYQVAWLNWSSADKEWNGGTIQAGKTYSLNISVRNTGWYAWPHAGASNIVRLGYHWLDNNGQVVALPPGGDVRTRLDREVAYGHSYEFSSAQVVAPQTPGAYTLVWDMVHEGVTWFHDANRKSPVLEMRSIVAGAPSGEFGAVRNGGFEQDGDWTIFETPRPARYTEQVRRSGRRSLQTGIRDLAENAFSYSSVEQTFDVPTGDGTSHGDLTLRYWYQARMEESDFGYVYLRPQGGVWRLLQIVRRDVPAWTEAVHDLREYAGRQVTLRLGTFNGGSGNVSAMYVDDVSAAAGAPPTPVPSLCVEAAQNGDMEMDEGWAIFETPYPARYATAAARTGARSMQLGMTDPAQNVFSYSSAEQRLSIPIGRQATLSLWYYVPQGGGQGDYGYLLLQPGGGSWRILRIMQDATDDWIQVQEDVSYLAGQSFTLRLGLRNDGGAEHAFMYVDSVSVQVCQP